MSAAAAAGVLYGVSPPWGNSMVSFKAHGVCSSSAVLDCCCCCCCCCPRGRGRRRGRGRLLLRLRQVRGVAGAFVTTGSTSLDGVISDDIGMVVTLTYSSKASIGPQASSAAQV